MSKTTTTDNTMIAFKDLKDLFDNKNRYYLNEQKGHFGVPEGAGGYQDEYNETFMYYKHPGMPDGVFMRETYHTDSYGYDPTLVKIEFVVGKAKTVTIYEPI